MDEHKARAPPKTTPNSLALSQILTPCRCTNSQVSILHMTLGRSGRFSGASLVLLSKGPIFGSIGLSLVKDPEMVVVIFMMSEMSVSWCVWKWGIPPSKAIDGFCKLRL